MFSDEHARRVHLLHRNPLRLEAEVGQLLLHDFGDSADAFKVVRAAIDVDEFLEQGFDACSLASM